MVSKTKFSFNGKAFNEHLYDDGSLPPYYHGTTCCALGVMSLNNGHSIKEIKKAMEHIKQDSLSKRFSPAERWFGERNLLTIVVSPNEDKLEKNLLKIGWKCIADNLPRRNGYPENAKLKMYLYSFQ